MPNEVVVSEQSGQQSPNGPDNQPESLAGEPSAVELAARLDGLSASLPGFCFRRRMDPGGTIRYLSFSGNVRAILGFAPDAMRINGEGCLQVIHWADRAAHMAAVRRSASELSACVEEFRAITHAGEVRWLKGASRPRRTVDGGVEWDGVLIDVTDGRRAEIRLDMLMEHAADAILIVDGTGHIDALNAATERLFLWSERDLVGMPLPVLLADNVNIDTLLSEEGGDGCILGGTPCERNGLRSDRSVFALELSAREVRLDGRRQFVIIGRDITARKETETALHESQERLAAIAGNLPGVIFQRLLTSAGEISYTYISDGCRAYLGASPEEIQADPDRFCPRHGREDDGAFLESLGRSARTGEPMNEEMAVVGADGKRRWLRGQSRPTRRSNGDVVWDGVMLDVTDRRVAEKRLSFLAFFDPLTRLPNRPAFIERLTAAMDHARPQGEIVGLVSLGIDRFGVINATMGHEVGDQVLVTLADQLQAAIQGDNVLARITGDRFALLMTGHASRKSLGDAIERLHTLAQATVSVGDEVFQLSVSAGVAVFPRDGEDAETLIKNSEAALQLGKDQGAACLQFFTKEMSAQATRILTLKNRLRRAVDQGEFIPFYQPQVDLNSGEMVGIEALVRWISPDLGMVPPVDFIPVAEESGLIDAICEIMLRKCAAQNRSWLDQGLNVVPIAVNVSGRQFQAAQRLISTLEDVLAQTRLEPRLLEIELTESSAMRDPDNAIRVVAQLNDMGIHSAIDDFGTGYSSLSVLKRFPISKLKIDRSFVMDIISDPNDAAIVDAIVAMAKALKMKVVAEGVEHEEHLEFLRAVGCDQMQGYYFSRPVPGDEMGRMLADGRRLSVAPARRKVKAV